MADMGSITRRTEKGRAETRDGRERTRLEAAHDRLIELEADANNELNHIAKLIQIKTEELERLRDQQNEVGAEKNTLQACLAALREEERSRDV